MLRMEKSLMNTFSFDLQALCATGCLTITPVGPMVCPTPPSACRVRGIFLGTFKVGNLWMQLRSEPPFLLIPEAVWLCVCVCVRTVQHGMVYQECKANGQWDTEKNTSECDSDEPPRVRNLIFITLPASYCRIHSE